MPRAFLQGTSASVQFEPTESSETNEQWLYLKGKETLRGWKVANIEEQVSSMGCYGMNLTTLEGPP